jgi:hypothetical protein
MERNKIRRCRQYRLSVSNLASKMIMCYVTRAVTIIVYWQNLVVLGHVEAKKNPTRRNI